MASRPSLGVSSDPLSTTRGIAVGLIVSLVLWGLLAAFLL
jgi:tetrahydromethanopterin S-methyltransferase subunit F